MRKRITRAILPIALALAFVPTVAHGTAQAASEPTWHTASGTACTSWSIGWQGTEDQDHPMDVTISASPHQQFFLEVRVLNTGAVVGRVLATTDSKGNWKGAVPTWFDPSRSVQGLFEFRQVGCNFPPNFFALTIQS